MVARTAAKHENASLPFYQQVANVLRARILNQDDTRPYALETEHELCRIHRVSRITIRKALDVLEQEALIHRKPRRGTLTIPENVLRYRQLRHNRVIHMVTVGNNDTNAPSRFYGQLYQGILTAVEQAEYLVSVDRLDSDRTEMPRAPVRPPNDTTLGILMVGIMHEPLIDAYVQMSFPVVSVDYWTANRKADAVVMDCFDEGQQAAEMLLRQGHTRLFYVGHMMANGHKEADSELMLAGMQRAMERAGLPPIPSERIRFLKDPMHGLLAREIEYLTAMWPPPTGGVVFNMATARLLIELFGQAGRRCPQDISIIGKTWETNPTDITCLRGSPRILGQMAVECLLQRATGKRDAPVRLALLSRMQLGTTVTYLSHRDSDESHEAERPAPARRRTTN